MVIVAPKLMDLNFEKLLEQMRKEAIDSVPGWSIPEGDPASWPNNDPGLALLKIFAHMHMEIISRLNRVPDKNFAAFLDMIGISLRPARPARVPVTFYPVEDYPESIFVAAGTPVTTSETEVHPVLTYQTQKNFSACDTPIIGMYCIDKIKDEIYDHLPDLTTQRPLQPFRGDNLQKHILYLGHSELFRVGGNTDIKLRFSFTSVPGQQMDGNQVWEYTGEDGAIENVESVIIKPGSDNLAAIVTLSGISGIKETEVNGISSLWISCRQNGGYSSFPEIKSIRIAGLSFSDRAVGPDYAYYNFTPLNLKLKDTVAEFQDSIYPFGRTPRLFDSFYIASMEVFSKAGAKVKIEFTIPVAAVGSTDLKLTWECFNGQVWKIIAPEDKNDTSNNLISTGSIKFSLPRDIQECDVHGVQNYWIRATITEGDYGHEEVEVSTDNGKSTYTVKKNFCPPRLTSLAISLSESNIDPDNAKPLEHCLAYNNLQYTDLTERAKGEATGFKPFVELPGTASERSLFLCFRNPFLEGNISLFFYVNEALKPSVNPSLAWSYWGGDISLMEELRIENDKTKLRLQSSEELMSQTELMIQEAVVDSGTGNASVKSDCALISSQSGNGWLKLDRRLDHAYTRNAQVTRRIYLQCQDRTEYLTRAETLDFMATADQKKTIFLGKEGYWLMSSLEGDGDLPPLLGVYPNTVWAEQVETVTDEILGSSEGEKDMTFRLQNKPVVSCEIWILEEIVFSEEEKDQLRKDLSIVEVTDDSGFVVNTWVRWIESEDLFESDSGSRHYALDRALGQISFGDGKMGKIPPIGTDNIKATYTWGGGVAGNVSSGEINTIGESLAGMDRVDNCQPAEGGSDTEAMASALECGPHLIKHRNRAVTREDYERLAKEASSFIARTKCFTKASTPGSLYIIVIPNGTENRPTPSQGLMDLVKDYLMERSSCAISPGSLKIVPPIYREIRISVDVHPTSIDLAVPLKRKVTESLNSYLHPLTGGPGGSGWDFGRRIYRSDLYSMLEGIGGVDHVENLLINELDSDAMAEESMEIPCTGRHNIKIVTGA